MLIDCSNHMKMLLPLLFLLISFFCDAQSAQDQEVFNNKVWKEVPISINETSFFDVNDNFLGSKIKSTRNVIYRDKWQRTLRVIVIDQTAARSVDSFKVKKEKKANTLEFSNQVIVRRNKATYYNVNGYIIRTAKRRGKKVFFHDKYGKLIGYKVYNSNGTKTYKDSRGRVTGRSYINKTGTMIYRAKNKRTRTSRVLFENPFLFS